MNAVETIKAVMKAKKITQAKLAERAGYRSQSNVTGMLNRGGGNLHCSSLFEMLDAMGCDLVVRDRENDAREWVITFAKEDLEELRKKAEGRYKPVKKSEPVKKSGKKINLEDLLG